MKTIPRPRYTPSKSKKEEVLNPHLKISKIESEHDRVSIWGTLEKGEAVQIAIPLEVFENHHAVLQPGKWVETKGIQVVKGEGEPFFITKQPPHRLGKASFKRYESDEEVGDFEDSFFAEQKCDAFGIDYDGMDNDCDDCMFAPRCRTETQQLNVDVSEHLEKAGLKRPAMIEKIPSWKDMRPMILIGHGTGGDITYDNYHRCKVCNGNVRIMIFEEGDETWQDGPTLGILFTDKLECPHCEAGQFRIETGKKAAKA